MNPKDLRIGNIVGAGILFDDEGEETGPMPSLHDQIAASSAKLVSCD
jgi:hypothetical protein